MAELTTSGGRIFPILSQVLPLIGRAHTENWPSIYRVLSELYRLRPSWRRVVAEYFRSFPSATVDWPSSYRELTKYLPHPLWALPFKTEMAPSGGRIFPILIRVLPLLAELTFCAFCACFSAPVTRRVTIRDKKTPPWRRKTKTNGRDSKQTRGRETCSMPSRRKVIQPTHPTTLRWATHPHPPLPTWCILITWSPGKVIWPTHPTTLRWATHPHPPLPTWCILITWSQGKVIWPTHPTTLRQGMNLHPPLPVCSPLPTLPSLPGAYWLLDLRGMSYGQHTLLPWGEQRIPTLPSLPGAYWLLDLRGKSSGPHTLLPWGREWISTLPSLYAHLSPPSPPYLVHIDYLISGECHMANTPYYPEVSNASPPSPPYLVHIDCLIPVEIHPVHTPYGTKFVRFAADHERCMGSVLSVWPDWMIGRTSKSGGGCTSRTGGARLSWLRPPRCSASRMRRKYVLNLDLLPSSVHKWISLLGGIEVP